MATRNSLIYGSAEFLCNGQLIPQRKDFLENRGAMINARDNNFGVNVIGHVSGNLGLGVLARGMIDALTKNGIGCSVLDLDPGAGRHHHDNRFDYLSIKSFSEFIHPVNLFVLPPATITEPLFNAISQTGKKINAAFTVWELPDMPLVFKENLERLDVLIGATKFVTDVLNRNVKGKFILRGMHPFIDEMPILSEPKNTDKKELTFITGFEPFSDMARKNPYGVIDAFKSAFPSTSNVKLVVKVNNPYQENGLMHEIVRLLIQSNEIDSRISFDLNIYDHESLYCLYQTADVGVSLHRSEGFGLFPLELMLLGKPVIANSWSGNSDYMNASNSFPVRHHMIPANGSLPIYQSQHYPQGTQWADPLISDASYWMRFLYENRQTGLAVGARAQKDAKEYIWQANQLSFLNELSFLSQNFIFS